MVMSAERSLYPGPENISRIRKVVGRRMVFYDIDAICEDSLTPVLDKINVDFLVNIQRTQVTGFDSISRHLFRLRPDLKLSFEQFRAIEWQYWINPNILSRAGSVPGIQFLMFMMDCAGIEQNLVTSRNPELKDITLELKPKYPFINNIYIRGESQRDLPGDVFKALIVKNNFLVEDFLPNVQRVAKNIGSRIMWLSWPDDNGTFKSRNVLHVPNSAGNIWPAWARLTQ